jgi:hypothetical protein
MVSNDRTILDEVLRRGMGEISSSTTESSLFEYFTAEQVLKQDDCKVGEGGLQR